MKLYPSDPRFAKSHLVIIGMTGSGKTYETVRMAFAPPADFGKYSKVTKLKYRVVFFDTSNVFMTDEYRDILVKYGYVYPKIVIRVRTPEMFIKAWDYGAKFIVVSPYPTETEAAYRSKVIEIMKGLKAFQASLSSKDRWPLYLYFDEISDLVHKMKENPITFVFKRGRQLNMWGRAISQRPQMVNKILFNESRYKLFFMLTDDEWSGLETGTYRIRPPEDIKERLHKVDYLYYIYDGHKWEKGKVRTQ